MKRMPSFIAGIVVGGILFGGSAAYAAGLIAEPSKHTVYLDGNPVELEAYTIEGSNYVKLRDVGMLLDFNVYWDGAVRIDSDAPYTGEASKTEPEPASELQHGTDWSRETDASVFDAVYTRDAYNALRQTIIDADKILSGAAYSYRNANLSEKTASTMMIWKMKSQRTKIPKSTINGKKSSLIWKI